MKSITGVFTTRTAAQRALVDLRGLLPPEHLSFLSPASSTEEVQAVPKTEDMPPVGTYLGGALGGALGLGLAASILIPGLGAVTVLGAAATALAGALGAGIGSRAGAAVDNAAFRGVPADELYVYEDALRQGRTVVIAIVDGQPQDAEVHEVMERAGAESVDSAENDLRVGLQDSPHLTYEQPSDEMTTARLS